jgi:hypothetical protein
VLTNSPFRYLTIVPNSYPNLCFTALRANGAGCFRGKHLRHKALRIASYFRRFAAEDPVITTPEPFNLFIEELASPNPGGLPYIAGTERLMDDYGIEVLSPPLS